MSITCSHTWGGRDIAGHVICIKCGYAKELAKRHLRVRPPAEARIEEALNVLRDLQIRMLESLDPNIPNRWNVMLADAIHLSTANAPGSS